MNFQFKIECVRWEAYANEYVSEGRCGAGDFSPNLPVQIHSQSECRVGDVKSTVATFSFSTVKSRLLP